ncbi:hypothetical protein ABB37_01636 [Leptomonas pyrrhocoris]|uniref:non-specific serine/threonine protein kinase n=1 Tax=Leptomonas pyrrhocoris TaxID=157538 RepID=A0A0M9G909_LEPPY|nr:hypothetical protein ABB37_01636 [Leptomonas pyrrhocoris]KPA85300.1 hypothetical protein ABB37_01636 [Leptomonas pyrrhocoris]|eukprot:XP_015663739.1 hypothetical protein ABB37_01636 [Leptomonas pyrrhocoris]
MIRKKVLSIGNNSATLLVQDTEANGALRVLRRISVAGWCEDDVKMAEEACNALRGARLRGFVPIHAVLVQNSFLSVVTSYAPEGDVSTFLEDELDSPLEEQMVLRWLCASALSIREMQAHKLYFPGLTTDRLFLDHQTGGTAQILLGVPLALPVYINQMQERRNNGVNVSLDYPPEVLAQPKWSFHATATDVWCLGRLGEVLLTAKGTGLARRSGSTRQLIARMMAPEPTKRPSMESVAQSLIALAGNVKLGQPLWPAKKASTTSTTAAPTPAAPPPPPAPSSHPPTPLTTHQPVSLSASNNSVSNPPPSSSTSSPPPEVPTTRLHNSRNKSDTGTPVHQPPPPPPQPQAPVHRDAVPRPAHAPDDSWHQRAQHQFEQLQRLNASPQKVRNDGQVSPRGPNADRRRMSVERKSPSPRRGVRGSGPLDQNTRMLNEMFAEQEGFFREANGSRPQRRTGQSVEELQQLQADAMRQMKLDTAQRQHEMRRHFTEWQRQNNQRYTEADNALVMEQDGVMILAPRPTQPHAQPSIRAAAATPSPLPSEKTGDSHSTPPTTVASEDGLNDAAQAPRPAAATPGPRNASARGSNKPYPKTPPAASPLRRATPKSASSSSFNRTSASAPGGLSSAAVPLRGSASPRPQPAPQLSSVPPHVRKNSESNIRPVTSLTDNGGNGECSARLDNAATRRGYVDSSMHSAVEWSVDGIRSTLRTLLRNRDLYGDVMQEVAVFVSQKEEARLSARANEVFMYRLRKLLPDDRLFYGAAPLCGQLVALEGLNHTLRNSVGGPTSR